MENNNFTNMDFEMPSEVLDKIQENIQDIIKSFDIPDDNKMDVIKKINFMYTQTKHLSETDALTRLSNRRCFESNFDREFARSKRYGNNLSVAVVDIDFFKKINDTYGHLCGDYVLREVAYNMINNFRQTDYVFRYGGEEFIIVLYKIEALNLSSDLRLSYNGKIVSANDIKNMSFYNRHQVFELYSYVDNLCTDELIKKVVVDLPTVNSYYYFNKEKCLENPDFKYCQEFLDIKDISYEEIDKLFQEYIKKDDNNSSKKNNNYLLYILIGISVAIIITITLVIKHRKNKEDL